MKSSFDFGIDADKRRHSNKTHYKQFNDAAYEGDIGPYTPIKCNIDVCIDTKRVR